MAGGLFGAEGGLSKALFGDPQAMGGASEDLLELLMPLFEQATSANKGLLSGATDFFQTGQTPDFLVPLIQLMSAGALSQGSNARRSIDEATTRAGITGSERARLQSQAASQAGVQAAGVPIQLMQGILPMLLQLLTNPFGADLLAQIAGQQTAGLQGANAMNKQFVFDVVKEQQQSFNRVGEDAAGIGMLGMLGGG